MKLKFLGATSTVTGSKYLLTSATPRSYWIAACSRDTRSCACATGHSSPSPRPGSRRWCSPTPTSVTALTCHCWSRTGFAAAIVTIRTEGKTIVFSAALDRADYMVLESTYCNKRHDRSDPLLLLGKTIGDTAARGGVTVIPSFAAGRAQSLLYDIHRLKEHGEIPAHLPVCLNSPMAADVTALYQKHLHDHRLSHAQCNAMHHAAIIVNSVEQSIALNQKQLPMVIVAASGMATGGRVLHHLKAFAPDSRNTR